MSKPAVACRILSSCTAEKKSSAHAVRLSPMFVLVVVRHTLRRPRVHAPRDGPQAGVRQRLRVCCVVPQVRVVPERVRQPRGRLRLWCGRPGRNRSACLGCGTSFRRRCPSVSPAPSCPPATAAISRGVGMCGFQCGVLLGAAATRARASRSAAQRRAMDTSPLSVGVMRLSCPSNGWMCTWPWWSH